jgi:molybdopterin-guanine dinucleotide biosynthesis protein A
MERLAPHVGRLLVIAHPRNAAALRALPVDGVLTDLKPDHGPLMGVYTGLMRTETPLNLFVPCDMPWIEARLIQRLMAACDGHTDLIAGRHPLEGPQPFPLLCHVNACRAIGALLDRGERSLQALLRRPGARLVRIDDPGLWRSFTNVNTVADYARLTEATVTP